MKPKLIYLARRQPTLTRDEFILRWRRHGALGMSLPRWTNVWRYTHNDISPEDRSRSYDGVGMVWHRSPEARLAHREDRTSQSAMERDELETFDDLIARSCALYREEVVVAPSLGKRTKVIRLWEGDPGTASGIANSACGFVRNRRMPPQTAAWGLPYALIEELWFADAAAAMDALGDRLAPSLLVEETVLYRTRQV